MNDKEYTYDIDKYTIGVDENGEDGIGLTVAKVENGEIYFLDNCYGENARCLNLLIKENQELKNIINQIGFEPDEIAFLQQDNAELKKQVEEIEKCLKDMYHINIENDKELEKLKTQQKEFIKYLENEIKIYSNTYMGVMLKELKEILQKYKSIIGV